MISLNFHVDLPYRYRAAIAQAVSLLGTTSVLNIWNHGILKANLPSNVARDLINCQKFIKRRFLVNVGNFCTYCHVYHVNGNRFELDHFLIKNVAGGGARFSYELKNLVLVCEYCNAEKSAKKTAAKNSVARTGNYQDLKFTHFHPNLHHVHDFFNFHSGSVELSADKERAKIAKAFLEIIDYFDAKNSQQILGHLRNRHNFNKEFEAQVELILSTPRIRSGAV